MAIVIRADPEATFLGPIKIKSYEIDFDSSYPTNGEAWNLSADFDVIKGAVFESKAGYEFEITSKDAPASSLIKVYRAPAETFSGTALDPATKVKAFVKSGAAAGAHTITGLAAADKLISVLDFNNMRDLTSAADRFGSLIDLTTEFSVTGVSVINNTGGTATSAKDRLLVLFAKSYTPAGTNAAAALAETANATNLATVTKVGVLIWGSKS